MSKKWIMLALSMAFPLSAFAYGDLARTSSVAIEFDRAVALSKSSTRPLPPSADTKVAYRFQGEAGAYQVRVPLVVYQAKGAVSPVALAMRFSLNGWEALRYVAYGIRTADGRYLHVKNAHPDQGRMLDEQLSACGYERVIAGFEPRLGDLEGASIEIYVHGQPSAGGADLLLADASVDVLENCEDIPDAESVPQRISRGQFKDAFDRYNYEYYEGRLDAAKAYLDTGEVQLRNLTPIRGDWRDRSPDVLKQTSTHRYLWSALDLSRVLLVAYEQEGKREYADAAYRLAERWVDENLVTAGKDQRYIWYDHGTGDRLMVLVMLFAAADELGWSEERKRTLAGLAYRHAELLANDWFYARNQPLRWHNHGVFQDIALLTAAELVRFGAQNDRWRRVARSRLLSQFTAIVATDGGSIENSFGYHVATERMCESSAGWLQLTGDPSPELVSICEKMGEFTAAISYPDGRGASYGDSFRIENGLGSVAKTGRLRRTAVNIFEKSGYAVVKGGADEIAWQLTFYAPALSKTHKHEDNLNITYWAGGVEWIVDPGFYSHQYEDPVPSFARGVGAHNAPAVEGATYSIEPGAASIQLVKEGDSSVVFVGTSNSFANTVVRRSINVGKYDGSVSVQDELRGLGGAAWQHAFQFGEQVRANIFADRIELSSDLVTFKILMQYPGAGRLCKKYSGGAGGAYGFTYPAFMRKVASDAVVCKRSDAAATWKLSIENEI